MNAPARTGALALQDMAPLPGWPKARWETFAADAWSFRRQWGQRAVELGWTPLELFGVSREKPFAIHAWGAVPFINGTKVVEVTETTIWIETGRDHIDPDTGEVTVDRLRISKRKVAAGVVLAWEHHAPDSKKIAA